MANQVTHETVREMVEVMFPNRKGTNLATHAVNFLISQVSRQGDSKVDIATLQMFVEFLITKNYN
jgi:hypothetical protein